MKIKTILRIVFSGLVFTFSLPVYSNTGVIEENPNIENIEKKSQHSGFQRKKTNPNPHEIGFYFKDYLPVARMRNHSYSFVGAGLSYAWHTPYTLLIPESFPKWFGDYWNVGISSRFDFVTVSKNDDYIINWWTMNLHGGAFFEWVVNDWIELQPSFEYGIQLDVLKSTRHANGPYISQCFLISPTVKIKPLSTLKDNLSFDLTPFWNFSFETDGVANYFGVRVGAMYRIGDKQKNIKDSKSEIQIQCVEKEVIKEVPVYIEKEVIKEVPVYIEKEVIKEVPVYIEKEVIKEVPVYIEKEVIKEIPVYIERTSEEDVGKTEESEEMLLKNETEDETKLESVSDVVVSNESEIQEEVAEVEDELEFESEAETL